MTDERLVIYNGVRFWFEKDWRYAKGHVDGKLKYLHRYVWECNYGEIPKGFEIHHIDGDKRNNDIKNLIMIPSKDHRSLHGKTVTERKKQHLDNIRDLTKEWHTSDEGRKWHKEHYEQMKNKLHIIRDFVCEMCGKEFTSTKVGSRFCSNACKSAWRRKKGLDNEVRVCPICGKNFTVNKYSKTTCCSITCVAILKKARFKNT